MSEEVLTRYRRKLDEEIDRISRHILNGKCKDHPEYLGRIGEIMSFRRAKENLKRSIEEMQADDKIAESNDNRSNTAQPSEEIDDE